MDVLHCEYCSCKVFSTDRKCPACGAPIKLIGKLSKDGSAISGMRDDIPTSEADMLRILYDDPTYIYTNKSGVSFRFFLKDKDRKQNELWAESVGINGWGSRKPD